MYPLPIDRYPKCIHCKELLVKRHSINGNRPAEAKSVMGWFSFGVGPFCIYCQTKAWTDREFFERSGHSDYHWSKWNLNV